MMKFAVNFDGPVSLRYPKGDAYEGLQDNREPIVHGKSRSAAVGQKTLRFWPWAVW